MDFLEIQMGLAAAASWYHIVDLNIIGQSQENHGKICENNGLYSVVMKQWYFDSVIMGFI